MRARLIITALGLLLAYSAAFFGNGLHEAWNTLDFGQALIVLFGIIVTIVGGGAWVCAMGSIIEDENDSEASYLAALALILLSALFGILAGPFRQGPYPWQWVSMWDIILLLGLVPVVLTLALPKKE